MPETQDGDEVDERARVTVQRCTLEQEFSKQQIRYKILIHVTQIHE